MHRASRETRESFPPSNGVEAAGLPKLKLALVSLPYHLRFSVTLVCFARAPALRNTSTTTSPFSSPELHGSVLVLDDLIGQTESEEVLSPGDGHS
ncbi:uncharacterized protein PHACADRAFT_262749 [Phanerochaete carnosa HHB-10118-sp]|uniref:Uncharacterized protein n=1 Tax=Phanerochaete carnosa (strain HHB-10118-sp) TaxID=650164 RepID=K5WKU9_PHACS|nr:uncharacterized protein PHACADRAFT_262749 [Phanerochaete carnosa HHB-10118-sp]EKM50872.1 hypothetical protein PHACADRAFT_262749 [Phanerochaete carnosa HHB-10118-sp]